METLNLNNTDKLFVGDVEIKKLYAGNKLIWKKGYNQYFSIEPIGDNPNFIISCNKPYYTQTEGYNNWNLHPANSSVGFMQKIYVKAEFTPADPDNNDYSQLTITYGKCKISGNIMSLVNGDDFLSTNAISDYQFDGLFQNSDGLWDASELILPAHIIEKYAYAYMFNGCTNLQQAPELLGEYMDDYCYKGMFEGCTSLTTPPALPAFYLDLGCYEEMFKGCTSLIEMPDLKASSVAQSSYSKMFSGCTSLVTAKDLMAPDLNAYCYANMFENCTSLTTAPKLPATTLIMGCYSMMFYNCTSLTTAPELPAPKVEIDSYSMMFTSCSHLNYVKALATNVGTSPSILTQNWLYGVSRTGTFVKKAGAQWPTGGIDGVHGIPYGWTVQSV